MRVLPYSTFIIAITCLNLNGLLFAQQPAPKPPVGNMISNGGFESAFRRDNPWDGVNQSGYLEGQRGAVPALTQSGTIADTSMPVSVAVSDMNGDGKLDIAMSDVTGYFRVFFNKGTKQEPKFGKCELIPVFLTRTARYGIDRRELLFRYQAQHITVGDFARSGKNDILIGNYIGEVLWLKNQGSVSAPDFRQPKTRESLLLPTTKDSERRWGNIFAPATWDWNGDGKFDLLLGEGSYSANSIHLLLNQGTANSPKFDEENRFFLAFGDGREQLTPAVVDYNGDGKQDLLVADRMGKIGLFLNKSDNWKPGDEIPFTSYVPIQGQAGKDLAFGGICTLSTGDLNGDGLFDLIVGKTSGRVAISYNKGTQTEPKFDAPQEFKADLPEKTVPLQLPSGWEVDYGLIKGNYNGYITTVSVDDEAELAPPEGNKALKFGYFPSNNEVIKSKIEYSGQLTKQWNFKATSFRETEVDGPANYFGISQGGRLKLSPGKSYTLTFKVKGQNATNCIADVYYHSDRWDGEKKIVRGDRGAAKVDRGNQHLEGKHNTVTFSPGNSWSTVKMDFKVQFNDKFLNDFDFTNYAWLFIGGQLPTDAEIYIDDVVVVEKP